MRRWIVAVLAVVVLAGATAVWAIAENLDSGPPTVTGCLTPKGDLVDFAVGGSPADDCRKGGTQLSLSGGDITSVVAGTGLEGGADGGSALIGIAERYRLPLGCADGDTARYSSTLQYWRCTPVFEPHTYTVFRRVPFTISAVGGSLGQRVLRLQLPPGNYSVAASTVATGNNGFSHLRCQTSPSIGAPSSGLVLADLDIGNTGNAVDTGTFGGTSAMHVAPTATIDMFCRSLNGSFGAFPRVIWATILATAIPDFTVAEDSSTSEYQYGS